MKIRRLRLAVLSFLPVAALLLSVLTGPLLADPDAPRFAIVSDTHLGGPAHSAYAEIIRALDEEGISVIVHTGDAINTPGDASAWAEFLKITGPGKTLHLAPGNHDIRGAASFATYMRLFDTPFSSYAEGDTLFVLLNTEMPGEESRIGPGQFEWLAKELERPFRYKLVFMHEPLFPAMPHHGLDRHRAARDELHRLFVREGVALVVAGHDHIYEKQQKDGVEYVLCGRAGGRASPGKNGNSMSYIIAERMGASYVLTVRDLDGDTKDRIIINKPLLPAAPAGDKNDAPEEEEPAAAGAAVR